MNNQTLLIKVKERLNKLASDDYDNIENWQIIEAFNKAQLEFARREAKKGENEKQTIEDINILLTTLPLSGLTVKHYFESSVLPGDYLSFKRVSFNGVTSECIEERPFKVYLGEEANTDEYYRDAEKQPSFEWAETFITFIGNKLRIHTNDKFTIKSPKLTYYRQPKNIQIIGTIDPYTGIISTVEQICEFKDDVVEFLIDECVLILSGDIESMIQTQRISQTIQRTE